MGEHPASGVGAQLFLSTKTVEAHVEQIYRRLAEVKAKYDPDNAFHHNQNIRPG